MAFRSRRRSTYRRRSKRTRLNRRRVFRRRYHKGTLLRNNTFGGFPKSKLVKLRYNQTVSVNPSIGLAQAYSFRANSIFDPDQTGSGHQPMGHDLWANVYNHYCVVGARMRCTFTPVNSGSGIAAFGIRLDDDGASSSTLVTDYIESGQSVYRIQPDNYTITKLQSLSKGFSAKKWFGIKNISDNISRIGALFGTNPSEQASFILWVGPVDESADLGAWQLTVTIEYSVLLTEPKDQTRN